MIKNNSNNQAKSAKRKKLVNNHKSDSGQGLTQQHTTQNFDSETPQQEYFGVTPQQEHLGATPQQEYVFVPEPYPVLLVPSLNHSSLRGASFMPDTYNGIDPINGTYIGANETLSSIKTEPESQSEVFHCEDGIESFTIIKNEPYSPGESTSSDYFDETENTFNEAISSDSIDGTEDTVNVKTEPLTPTSDVTFFPDGGSSLGYNDEREAHSEYCRMELDYSQADLLAIQTQQEAQLQQNSSVSSKTHSDSGKLHNQYTCPGHFLPFSRGRISGPFPIENSHLFPDTMLVFPIKISKKKKHFFFYFLRGHYYL